MKNAWNYFNEQQDPFIVGLDTEFMATLDRARHAAEIPFIVTSGKRSFIENEKAGGVSDSAHLSGHAADIRCRNSHEAYAIINGALTAGINRIVVGIRLDSTEVRGFRYHNIHLDDSKDLPQAIMAVKIYKEN